MTYAIVQKDLVVPDLDRLKRAFAVSPQLTGLDAQTAVNDAYGILWRGLDLTQGEQLKQALLGEGIETELVEEALLPPIPPPKMARQAEFRESHLGVYDSMRHPAEIPWSDIMFVAAGFVRSRDTGNLNRSEGNDRLLLDIFLTTGTWRCSIAGEEFEYDCLGARQAEDAAMNFVLLVQDIARAAPHAGLNRGAYLACQQPPELFPYPSKAAYNEEITWMLWRIAQIPVVSRVGI